MTAKFLSLNWILCVLQADSKVYQ